MTRRLLAGSVTVTAFVLLVLGAPLGIVFSRAERSRLLAGISQDATTVALWALQPLEQSDDVALQRVADGYRRRSGGRVVITGPEGHVRVDTAGTSAGSTLPLTGEIVEALHGRPARGSRTMAGAAAFYATVPVNSGGTVYGVVVVTHGASSLEERVRRTWLVLAGAALATLGAVAALSWILARSVTTPLRRLERAATDLGEGDLAARVSVPAGPPELELVARVFNDTAGKLERLVTSQRAFVADASHQLRTPLGALRLRLEIAERVAGPAAREDMEAATGELNRLSRLVDGLLALAAAEHARAAPRPIDVGDVAADRCAAWAPFASDSGVRLEARGAAVADVSPGTLEQVLDNLIANAVEASPPGSTVRVAVGQAGGWVEVHVTDQGPGMDPESRALAFTRLWRLPDSRRPVGGAGIGLAIVKQLVDNDGGRVGLEVAPGGGVDAVVRLRVARDRPAQAADRPDRPGIAADLYRFLDQPG